MLGGGGAVYGVYHEAKAHYPELHLPDLPDLPSFMKSSKSSDEPKPSTDEAHKFGFACTKLKNKKNQTECFNRFTKSLLEKQHNRPTNHQAMTKEEELSFFENQKLASLDNQKLVSLDVNRPTAKIKGPIATSSKIDSSKSIAKTISESFITKRQIAPVIANKREPAEILNTYLLNWVKAWQKRDINSYMAFYSKD
jgi:hypothetical protein